MKKNIFTALALLMLSFGVFAQTNSTKPAGETSTSAETPKKKSFRANKSQITQAQKMLKATETGKMDPDFKTAVKKYQTENGLKATGSLNRATLEKMNINLTDSQKEIPVDPSTIAGAKDDKSTETKKRGPVFRANKEQISEAQKMLKAKGLYAGEETGKLDDATREGIRKFQESGGIKVTGTLNKMTLEKMGIALTDKQKEM